ncbi:MAG: zinc-ribbon domain-containing protein, partial [Clostridia bacterium]|nr:zinc-ribbon domain-containing protein [Deltaproteobacteria bacterium]
MSMQVTCPHCGARYQFERSLIPPGGYDAQCANCSGIFPVAPSPAPEEMAIALPSMSMVDTWLTAPPIAPKKRAKETPPTAQNVAISAVESVIPVQQVVVPVPAAAPASALHSASHTAPHVLPYTGTLDYTIACPQCTTVYAMAVDDIPIGGLNATCPKCST